MKNNFEGEHGSASNVQGLCLACALCCDGAIFADVKLQGPDRARKLRELGLPVAGSSRLRASGLKTVGRPFFPQPCAALEGCRCRIYSDRPSYCRKFECALLQAVNAGDLRLSKALQTVRSTRSKVDKVLRFLHLLGNTDEHLPLAQRFHRTSRRLDEIGFDRASTNLYGGLTLAMHDLNLALSQKFYPAPALE